MVQGQRISKECQTAAERSAESPGADLWPDSSGGFVQICHGVFSKDFSPRL